MSNSNWPYRLMAPGPVPVPPVVMRAMSERLIHHRTPAFEKVLVETWAHLQMVFGTKQPVMILTGSGTAAMEAAVVNVVSPGDEVIVVVSGKFGERWAEMCERYGAKVHRLVVEWGSAVELSALESLLSSKVRAVFTEACETSTATVHPIREMARLIRARAPQAVIAVDAITAVGCMPLPMDEWELDIVIGGSQKAFMIPPGLAFIALSERAWAAQITSRVPKFYFDLAGERAANMKKENHFTIPTPLVMGLHMVLMRMQEVGMERVYRRCEALANAARVSAKELGLATFSKSPSPSVTAIEIPDSGKVRDWLERERNITLMGGQDHLKGKILRIGHMGDVRNSDMTALFQALAEHLNRPLDPAFVLRHLSQAETLFPGID